MLHMQVIKNGEMLGVAPLRNKNTVTTGQLALMGQQNMKVRMVLVSQTGRESRSEQLTCSSTRAVRNG